MNIFKMIWGVIGDKVTGFIMQALGVLSKKLIAELKDFAIDTVRDLQDEDLSSAQKRNEAFKRILAEAKSRGLEYSKSSINILIELAVQYLKKELGEEV